MYETGLQEGLRLYNREDFYSRVLDYALDLVTTTPDEVEVVDEVENEEGIGEQGAGEEETASEGSE